MPTASIIKVNLISYLHWKDPAHPAFEDTTRSDNILDPTDAKFVDIIHTNAGVIGHTANLGHADFWPNNGRATQPGCDILSDFFGACSHGRSYRYFAESLQAKDGFPSLQCNNWEDYLAGKCKGEAVVMGEAAPVTARGAYFLKTGAGPKFALTNKIKWDTQTAKAFAQWRHLPLKKLPAKWSFYRQPARQCGCAICSSQLCTEK